MSCFSNVTIELRYSKFARIYLLTQGRRESFMCLKETKFEEKSGLKPKKVVSENALNYKKSWGKMSRFTVWCLSLEIYSVKRYSKYVSS